MRLPIIAANWKMNKGPSETEDFLKIGPNNKIPVIVDRDTGLSLMESGAILLYLADRTGRLKPGDPQAYWEMVQWLMWQMGGLGPMLDATLFHNLEYVGALPVSIRLERQGAAGRSARSSRPSRAARARTPFLSMPRMPTFPT